MERLLKDYMVLETDAEGARYCLTCTVCGRVWKGKNADGAEESDAGRERAMEEAAVHNRVCGFCGRLVCGRCFEEVEGIALCVQCGERLRERLESDAGRTGRRPE